MPNVVGVIVSTKWVFYIHLVLGGIRLSVCEINGNKWRLDIKATVYITLVNTATSYYWLPRWLPQQTSA